ncbi:MAG: HAD hydrolase-like protein [Bacteroidetes bacterium]|nr:HAD hydrolase-like protein [Bacteroidota bacterium]MBU1678614.1 HAD hydrolase-like protein [Bacteroidota bacterium]
MKTIIIGDNLRSDIKGGINYGIDTIWFNPNNALNTYEFKPTFICSTFPQIVSTLFA